MWFNNKYIFHKLLVVWLMLIGTSLHAHKTKIGKCFYNDLSNNNTTIKGVGSMVIVEKYLTTDNAKNSTLYNQANCDIDDASNDNGTGVKQTKTRSIETEAEPTPRERELGLISAGEYFFDVDPGYGNATVFSFEPANVIDFTESLSIESLSDGMHTLYYRFKDDSSRWGATSRQSFFKSGRVAKQLTAGEFFLDVDPGFGNASAFTCPVDSVIDFTQNILLDSLSDGMHTIYYRFKDDKQVWGSMARQSFYKSGEVAQNIAAGEYFFDEDPGYGNASAFTCPADSVIDFSETISMVDLSDGMHTLYYRLKDDKGRWGITNRQSFNKAYIPQIAKVYYQIDDQAHVSIPVVQLTDVLEYITTYDTENLEDGNHQINVWVENEQSAVSEKRIEHFIKTGNIVEICEGDEYVFGTQTLTESGEYTEIFTSSMGEDSIVNISLVVNPVYNTFASLEISESQLPYSYYGQTIPEGTQSDTLDIYFLSVSGCDSIVTLNLTVLSGYSASFSITNQALRPIEGAGVVFNNATVLSDENGLAVFVNIEATTNMEYTISKEAYQPVSGMLSVASDTIVSITLIESANTLVSLPFYESYDENDDLWSTYNTLGDEEWELLTSNGVDNSPCMEITGYNMSAQNNEDWLISPAFDVSGISEVVLAFQSNVKYDGPGMKVFYSNDYIENGNPDNANWTLVSGVQVAQDSSIGLWETSGEGIISNNNEVMHLAFVYKSDETIGAATWQVDSVVVRASMAADTYSAIINVTDGANPLVGVSIHVNDVDYQSNAQGVVKIEWLEAGTYNYTVAAEGYENAVGSLTIVDKDITLTISLTEAIQKYNVIFNVSDGENPITNAKISFGKYEPFFTDELGQVTYTDVMPEFNIVYLIVANDFEEKMGLVSVVDQDVVVDLDMLFTGLSDAESQPYKIYPNPVNDVLNVSNVEGKTICIYAMNGNQMLKIQKANKHQYIDVAHLDEGLYLIKINTDLFKLSIKH